MSLYFLLLDIGLKYAGVEASALLRSKLFCNRLNIIPSFITSKYRSFHDKDFSELKKLGKINSKIININIYDILQNVDRTLPATKADYLISDNEKVIPVPGHLDKKVFDSNGELNKYIVFHKKYNLLHFINHFKDKRKWRRDFYDSLGFLSSTQFLHEDKSHLEIYYRRDRSVALIKKYNYIDNKLQGIEVQILNDQNHLIKVVSSEKDLALYALSIYFEKNNTNFALIVDRCRFYHSIALEIKKIFSNFSPKIFVMPVIHNMHSIVNNKTGKSRINVNYLSIFKNNTPSDVVLTQTTLQEQEIKRDFDYLNAFSIPHSYDRGMSSNVEVNRDNYKAIYLARYSSDKRHDLAIQAFSKVVEAIPNATFYCYGFGSLLADLNKQVISLGLEKNVFLCGWVDNISAEYLSAGLSIISSPSESFSLTIAESLAYGCPVVAFDVPYGPRELVINGENGYLVPYPDVEAMADKVIAVMQNKRLQQTLSEQAVITATRYSEATVAERWKTLFYDLGIAIESSADK